MVTLFKQTPPTLSHIDFNPKFADGTGFDFEAYEKDLAYPAEAREAATASSQRSIDAFYSPDRLGLRFGELYKISGITYRSLGLDVVWPGGTAVPSFAAGKIVANWYSPVIGYCTTMRTVKGTFITWCHIIDRLPVGHGIAKGQAVARIATYGEPHGSAWTGPHTAIHLGSTIASWYGVGARDPWPSIKANR